MRNVTLYTVDALQYYCMAWMGGAEMHHVYIRIRVHCHGFRVERLRALSAAGRARLSGGDAPRGPLRQAVSERPPRPTAAHG